MCGIAGFIWSSAGPPGDPARIARGMADALTTRGPDDFGEQVELDAGIAFGHRRLAIVDLSEAGRQPIASPSGRYLLVYNGEIYNHLELRDMLEEAGKAPVWRGHSDTETLIACIDAWGLEQSLRRCVGMFALGLWDRATRTLSLARDRLGEKPLYYGWHGGHFLFASELKALRRFPGFRGQVDRTAAALYMRRNYVPTPYSIYEDVYKLEPGCILEIDRRTAGVPASVPPLAPVHATGFSVRRYWSIEDAAASGQAAQVRDPSEAAEMLEEALLRAVREQMVADVPVGLFLSGGVDSGLLAALAARPLGRPLESFTIGFTEAEYDETDQARALAGELGIPHHRRILASSDATALIGELPEIYDEPFADSSQLATLLLCRFARESVKVALTGDGADELFGGYNRHVRVPPLLRTIQHLPRAIRGPIAAAIEAIPPAAYELAGRIGPYASPLVANKAYKIGRILRADATLGCVYEALVSEWPAGETPVLGAGPAGPIRGGGTLPNGAESHSIMLADTQGYLPDDILCKVDRAAMRVSLETRAPYLDHRVVELAWRLPIELKIRGREGKWLPRRLLERHGRPGLAQRSKAGFAVPLGSWLRHELREWVEDSLSDRRLAESNYLDPALVRAKWREHRDGRRDWTGALWSVLMLQQWLAAEAGRTPPSE